jgi:hypothetical protein
MKGIVMTPADAADVPSEVRLDAASERMPNRSLPLERLRVKEVAPCRGKRKPSRHDLLGAADQ